MGALGVSTGILYQPTRTRAARTARADQRQPPAIGSWCGAGRRVRVAEPVSHPAYGDAERSLALAELLERHGPGRLDEVGDQLIGANGGGLGITGRGRGMPSSSATPCLAARLRSSSIATSPCAVRSPRGRLRALGHASVSAPDIHLRLEIELRLRRITARWPGRLQRRAARCRPWRDKSVTAPCGDLLQYTLAYTGALERPCRVRDRRRMQHSDRTP